jgi:hypothetical protein
VPCKEVPTTGVGSQEAPGRWIDPDLEPIYELKPKDYECMINLMANLIIGTIIWLHEVDQKEAATSLGCSATQVLVDDDSDIVELIQLATHDGVRFRGKHS